MTRLREQLLCIFARPLAHENDSEHQNGDYREGPEPDAKLTAARLDVLAGDPQAVRELVLFEMVAFLSLHQCAWRGAPEGNRESLPRSVPFSGDDVIITDRPAA